ncbi:DUF305 domain-containing protein [Bradyrhizobium yuanmingense]|uniref:DUF305 domain-containing protein n=1 Tax=Bradyrhizobium yuanmingense TaxID=108015 RepID=UPI001CD76F6B|nr:DUF305 domain-containing protein [Bradyrhizobium yuanmingense]MCA1526529.1 DUF305 domain-containing protein [Bradyrhizobium yuanmingense]
MSTKLFARAFVIAALSAVPLPAFAQDAATASYKQSMEKMNAEMQKGMDPDPTKAWVKMMIAHHQGAIDMNKVVLKETKDPKIRKMAEKATGEQEKEIKQLQAWLTRHGG